MGWFALLAPLVHHGEAADPALLDWIKQFLDHWLGGGPWLIAGALGLVIALIPLAVVFLYWTQRRSA